MHFFMENVEIKGGAKIEEYVLIGKQPKNDCEKLRIGKNAVIRSHTVIYAGSKIGDNFQTGHNVIIREKNIIGNDCSVGNNTTLEVGNRIGNKVKIHSNCIIGESVKISNNVWIGPSVVTLAILHPPCPKNDECALKNSIVIEKNAKIGGNVTLAPGVVIGQNSLIGCGSVVTKNIPPDSVAVGNPAHVIKKIGDLECILGYYKTPYDWESKVKP